MQLIKEVHTLGVLYMSVRLCGTSLLFVAAAAGLSMTLTVSPTSKS